MIAFAHGIRAQGETTASLVTCLLPAVESSLLLIVPRAFNTDFYRSARLAPTCRDSVLLPFFFPRESIGIPSTDLNFIQRSRYLVRNNANNYFNVTMGKIPEFLSLEFPLRNFSSPNMIHPIQGSLYKTLLIIARNLEQNFLQNFRFREFSILFLRGYRY